MIAHIMSTDSFLWAKIKVFPVAWLCEMDVLNVCHLLLVVLHFRNDIFPEFDEFLLNIRIALGRIAVWKVEVDVIEIPLFETHELATSRDMFPDSIVTRRTNGKWNCWFEGGIQSH